MSKDVPHSEAPTRVRYGVLAFACVLSMITYLDRVCFGSAMTDIVSDLGLESVADLGLAVTAFAFSYAVFEVPSGWLGDMYGPRKTLIRIVLWWSFFTALTGVVGLGYVGKAKESGANRGAKVEASDTKDPALDAQEKNGEQGNKKEHVSVWSRTIPYFRVSLALVAMICVRFLFGMGEAGAYPNITRALHNWFPYSERGFTQGMVWMSGRLMGGLTPIIWGLLVAGLATTASIRTGDSVALKSGDTITVKKGREVTQADGNTVVLQADKKFKLTQDASAQFGAKVPLVDGTSLEIGEGDKYTRLYFPALLPSWRWAFWMFGVLGIIWCVFFAFWFRNRPEEKPSVNEAELALIQSGGGSSHAAHSGVPWLKLMTSGNLWILCLMYFCAAYGWYFNITYLPAFLEQQHQVESTSLVGMVYKGGPLLLGAVGCLGGGFFTDWFIRRTGNRRLGRRIMGLFGHALCALCMFACFFTPTAFTFFLAISFAAFFNDLTMGSAWSTCQDIGRKYAAIVAGCMNTIGNLGGAMAGFLTARVLKYYLIAHAGELGKAVDALSPAEKADAMLPGYQVSFITFGAVYVLATFCWLLIDSTKPIAPGDEHK